MTISFDRVADIYDETRALPPEIAEQVTNSILRLSAATPHTHFFEPGIGTGRIALPLVQRGYAYTGADISEKMMDKLRRKLKDGSHNLMLVNADITALPFQDACFDVVITAHVLHLIADWQQALAEIRRILKPGGVYLCFHHPSSAATHEALEQQWHEILTQYNFSPTRTGATTEEVLQRLKTQNADLETVNIATLEKTQTVDELLQKYQDRIYSTFWQIPDSVFKMALHDLEDWVQRRYPSKDVTFTTKFEVKITAARNWAGRA